MADSTGTWPSLAYADSRRRYRLDARIATGGMGEVWRATDTVLDREVAVKLLKEEHAEDAVFRSRFETEAQHAAGLHHPGVAQVFDFGSGDADHPPYLVMEHVDGQPLSALLRPGQPMDAEATSTLLSDVGDALGAAHALGIVHRDVKPANLLVTGNRQVKVTDFGIARAADAVPLTRTGEVLGTPQYLSPEQAEGKPATPASDVYSLGVVAFECLVGRRPFEAETPVATALAQIREPVPDLPATVPPALAAVVRRSLAKDPASRYADGTALATALRDAMSPAGAPALDPDPPETKVLRAPVPILAADSGAGLALRDRARRVPVPVWAAAAVLVLVIVTAVAVAATTGGDDSSPPASQRTPRTTAAATTTPSSPRPTAKTSGPATPSEKPDKGKGKDKHQGHDHGKGHQ